MLRIFIGAALGAGATYWIMHNAEVQKKKALIQQILVKYQGQVNIPTQELMKMDMVKLYQILIGNAS